MSWEVEALKGMSLLRYIRCGHAGICPWRVGPLSGKHACHECVGVSQVSGPSKAAFHDYTVIV
jgi:hypothetical protein